MGVVEWFDPTSEKWGVNTVVLDAANWGLKALDQLCHAEHWPVYIDRAAVALVSVRRAPENEQWTRHAITCRFPEDSTTPSVVFHHKGACKKRSCISSTDRLGSLAVSVRKHRLPSSPPATC